MGLVSPNDAIPKAKAAVQKALALDDSLPLALFIDGITKMGYDWDMRAAEAAFSRAIEVGPNNARGYSGLGYTLAVQGRLVEGLKQSLRGAELEPLTPIWTANAGIIYRWMRNKAGATEEVRKSLEVEPHFLLSRLELGRVHLAAGRLHEALQEFERAVSDSRRSPRHRPCGFSHALLGRRSEAEKSLARLQELAGQRYVLPSAAALVYLGLGDHDRVFDCLDKALKERELRMIHLKVDPILNPLRSDSRSTCCCAASALPRTTDADRYDVYRAAERRSSLAVTGPKQRKSVFQTAAQRQRGKAMASRTTIHNSGATMGRRAG